jgi:hypothetical protein
VIAIMSARIGVNDNKWWYMQWVEAVKQKLYVPYLPVPSELLTVTTRVRICRGSFIFEYVLLYLFQNAMPFQVKAVCNSELPFIADFIPPSHSPWINVNSLEYIRTSGNGVVLNIVDFSPSHSWSLSTHFILQLKCQLATKDRSPLIPRTPFIAIPSLSQLQIYTNQQVNNEFWFIFESTMKTNSPLLCMLLYLHIQGREGMTFQSLYRLSGEDTLVIFDILGEK